MRLAHGCLGAWLLGYMVALVDGFWVDGFWVDGGGVAAIALVNRKPSDQSEVSLISGATGFMFL